MKGKEVAKVEPTRPGASERRAAKLQGPDQDSHEPRNYRNFWRGTMAPCLAKRRPRLMSVDACGTTSCSKPRPPSRRCFASRAAGARRARQHDAGHVRRAWRLPCAGAARRGNRRHHPVRAQPQRRPDRQAAHHPRPLGGRRSLPQDFGRIDRPGVRPLPAGFDHRRARRRHRRAVDRLPAERRPDKGA